ncbi:hypothetical protein GCM10028807_11540 [Spirosoma daeguense]
MYTGKTYLRYVLMFVTLLTGFKVRSQSAQLTRIGEEKSITSKALNEKRTFAVSLPASYQTDDFYQQKRYPVCILLDADTHYQYVSSMIHFLSSGENEQIPEMIVIAVRNTNRTRDMTGGLQKDTDNFRAFLENELLSYIDQQYRTVPYRVLVGHSLAGLFTLNCFLDQRPFNAYIAIDPTLTWNSGFILTKTSSVFENNTTLTSRLYVSESNNPFNPGQHTGTRGKAFDTFSKNLASNTFKGMVHKFEYFDDETHFSVPFRSFYNGLNFVFDDYKFPLQTFLSVGEKGIIQHYQQLYSRLGADLLPPGKVINQMGMFLLMSEKQVDKALELLTLNAHYYPDSPIVYRSLGEAYRAKGDKEKAIQSFKKVLSLNSTDEASKKALGDLVN